MNAWHGLNDQVVALVKRLRPVGERIGAQAREGDALASKVVSAYSMLHASVDPMALHLTETALSDWEKREQESKPQHQQGD